MTNSNKQIRPIALYLPQFHPIPENDAWWGKGFTEWRNVVKARPRFKGHYQPHLPADLGYYDLRLEETRLAQEAMAKEYGVYGFCYYHYWFNGKRLLEEPLHRKLNNPKEDLPFMLCWANENWTRAWDGGENEILIKQEYSEEDDLEHIKALIPYFKDERYIKVDGKPVFVIYKDALFPDIHQTLITFREEAQKHGLELYLCRFERNDGTHHHSAIDPGFDAGIEFQPLSASYGSYKRKKTETWNKRPKVRMAKLLQSRYFPDKIRKIAATFTRQPERDMIHSYQDFIQFDTHFQNKVTGKMYPGVSPGWDNSSRRPAKKAMIMHDSNPGHFRYWLTHKLNAFEPFSEEENFLFINAWNEWAEGNHLEPCEKWGRVYLEALRQVLQ